MPNKKVF